MAKRVPKISKMADTILVILAVKLFINSLPNRPYFRAYNHYITHKHFRQYLFRAKMVLLRGGVLKRFCLVLLRLKMFYDIFAMVVGFLGE